MASIDKISLTLPESEFEIRSLSDKLRVKRKDRALNETISDSMEHLAQTKDGHLIIGHKIYANTDRFNVTISRLPTGSLSMLVSSNPNKWHHPWATSTDPEEYRVFRDGLESEIDSLGISCNLPAAKLSRLDLARQRQLTHPLYTYHRVFDCIHARRQRQSRHGDSILLYNKQRQASIYDKQAEADLDILEYHNLIRFETRFLTHETTSKYTGLKSLHDLDANIQSDRFEHLSGVYSGYLETEIFAKIDQASQTANGYRDHLQQLAEESPNRILERFLSEIGIFEATRQAGGSDELASIIASVREFNSEESRSRYHRRVRMEIEDRISAAMSRRTPKNATFGSLFDELTSFAKHDLPPISKTA